MSDGSERDFKALVLGDFPEAPAVFETELLRETISCESVHVADRDEFGAKASEPWVDVILIDISPYGLKVLEEVLEHRPMRPMLMVADPDKADHILEAKQMGLQRYVIRLDDKELTVELLAEEIAHAIRELWQPPSMDYPVVEEIFRYAQYHNVRQPLFVIGLDHQCLYVNKSGQTFCEDLHDRVPKPGDFIRDFPLEESSDEFQEHLDAAFEGESVEVTHTYEALPEEDCHRELFFQPVKDSDEKVVAVSIACKNIGPVVRAEERYERREELLWRYFGSSPVPLKTLDDDLVIRRCNEAYADLLGYDDPDELVGKNLDELVFPADVERTREATLRLVTGEDEYVQQEFRFLRKDESVLWIANTGFQVQELTPDGKPGLIFAITIDISRQKEAEERARQSGRMQVLGELASGVAHDFKNVLSVVTSFTQVLKKHLEDRNLEDLTKHVDKIESAADKGSALSRQLTSFGRKGETEPESLDLNEHIRDIDTLVGHLLGSNIDVELDLESSLPPIELGTGNIDQIIMNLTVNARDAMPDGGTLKFCTSRASYDNPKSTPHPDLDTGDYVILEVNDEGVGMDEETREHVFEPFFTTKEGGDEPGTGLGLTTVYKIVANAGGEIYVDSEPGEGTTFTLYFPVPPPSNDARE